MNLLCCPSEGLEEIAAWSVLQRRAATGRKEVRDVSMMQTTEVSHTLPQASVLFYEVYSHLVFVAHL